MADLLWILWSGLKLCGMSKLKKGRETDIHNAWANNKNNSLKNNKN